MYLEVEIQPRVGQKNGGGMNGRGVLCWLSEDSCHSDWVLIEIQYTDPVPGDADWRWRRPRAPPCRIDQPKRGKLNQKSSAPSHQRVSGIAPPDGFIG